MNASSIETNELLKYTKNILMVFVWLSGNILHAQQYDLFQVLEQGKKNYPSLKARLSEVQSMDRLIRSSKTEYLPSLIAQHQYTYSTNNNVTGSFFSNEGTALAPSGGIRPENIYEGTFGSFTSALLDWKIINFGKISAKVNVARSERNRSNLEYENELFQYQIRLADAYLLLLISHKLTLLQRANLERAEVYRDVVVASVRSGIKPGVDSALANAEHAKARLMLLESERNENSRQLTLYELLGGVQGNLFIDSMHFYNTIPSTSPALPDSTLNTPALRLYQSQIEVARAKSTSIRRSFYPSVSLTGFGMARGSGISNLDDSYRTDWSSGVRYQVYNYMAGVSLRWNITNYVRIRNDYKSALYQSEKFQYLYDEYSLQQDRQIKESEMQLQLMLAQSQLAPVQLKAAQAAFEQAKARYENGLTDLPTLTQSLLTLNRAEADQYIAYSNAWRSLLMKSAATGDFHLFLDQAK